VTAVICDGKSVGECYQPVSMIVFVWQPSSELCPDRAALHLHLEIILWRKNTFSNGYCLSTSRQYSARPVDYKTENITSSRKV